MAETEEGGSKGHEHQHHHKAHEPAAGGHRKPKWALTEGAAEVAEAKEEDAEAGDLVNFAKGLDFER